MPRLYSIAEGQGELQALPTLLRRIAQERFGDYAWQFLTPALATRAELAKAGGIERSVIRADKARPDAILVLLDTDGKQCAVELAAQLRERVAAIAVSAAVAVVCADQEYEAWFLAAASSLAGKQGLPDDLHYDGDPDAQRSPKGWVDRQLPTSDPYRETYHQAKLTAQLDLALAESRSRSFRRLIHALDELRHAYTTGETIYTPIPRKDSPNP